MRLGVGKPVLSAPQASPPLTYPSSPPTTNWVHMSAEPGTKENPQCGKSILYLGRISSETVASIYLSGCHHLTASRVKVLTHSLAPNPPSKYSMLIPYVRINAEQMATKGTGITQTSGNPFWNPSITHWVV